MNSICRLLTAVAATAALCLPVSIAQAQGAYPSRSVKIVVPFGPGTGLDVVARGYAERLTEQMKTPVVVENREGAGGTIGAVAVAKAAPDGYTIVFTANGPFAVTPYMQGGAPYDPLTDFVPITKVAVIPMVLVSGQKAPFTNFEEMAAYARANPGKLDYASSGIGTPSQLNVERIKQALNLDIASVPYKSTAQAMTDVISGQLPLYMPSFPAALGQLKSGQVRALAIGLSKRSTVMPDIPTVAEVLRQPGFEANVWYGFLAPRGTPQEVVGKLHAEIATAAASPQIRAMIDKLGAEAVMQASAEFASQLRQDADSARKLLSSLGVKPGQ